MSAEKYMRIFQNLLPRGVIWNRRLSSKLSKLLLGLGDEASRIDDRILTLVEEYDPRTTNELLSTWEDNLGLPDSCAAADAPANIRRARVVWKLAGWLNGQNLQFFIDLAAIFGYTLVEADFTFYNRFRVGVGRVGAAWGLGRIYGADWEYHWSVSVPSTAYTAFRVGVNRCGDALRYNSNDELECLFNKFKPAHTTVELTFV